MSHVESSGRVREHLQHVELLRRLGAGLGVRGVEGALGLPDLLPFHLDRLWVVLLHPDLRVQKSLSFERLGEPARPSPRCSLRYTRSSFLIARKDTSPRL